MTLASISRHEKTVSTMKIQPVYKKHFIKHNQFFVNNGKITAILSTNTALKRGFPPVT